MSAPPTRPRQVSCLALTFFYDYLESKGIPRLRIQEGLPYPPGWLDDRLNWIDYPTLIAVEDRVAALFPDVDDLFYDIGLTFASTKGLGFTRVVVRGLLSPYQTYARFPQVVPRFLFPFLRIRVEQVTPAAIRAHYTFSPDTPPSAAFLGTIRGILAGVPPIMGAPAATVVMTRIDTHAVVFDIGITHWTGYLDRMRAWWSQRGAANRMRRLNLTDAATELMDANRLLQEKVVALTEANAQVERKVRDLTLLNTLARATTSELDTRALLRAAARAISAGLGDAPVALLLVDGEPAGLVVAASSAVPSADLSALRRLADAGAPDTVRVSRGPGLLRVGARTWATTPMRSRERLVGAVLVAGSEGEIEPALLESMAGQLAVSVDNAQSFRVIADLRDTLEIRVRERTAELEEARTSLEDTVVRLEQADKAKDRFFTNVSHDFLTPLTLIIAPLEDLQAELAVGRTDGVEVTVRAARENALALHHLVSELLDFAKLDAGVLPMNRGELELCGLAQSVVDTLRPLADRKSVSLTAELSHDPVSVVVDAALLRRVLVNLVGNAVKYVHFRDRIVVRVYAEGGQAVLEVDDTGPGIAPENQAAVFERFNRGGARETVEGTGIGLAMARDIVRAHEGTLELESSPGNGACFRVRLPLGGSAPRVVEVHEPAPRAPFVDDAASMDHDLPALLVLDGTEATLRTRISVLVVEDNAGMRDFLVRVLARGHHVRAVGSGREAVEVAAREMPDIIVSDVMMANGDGLELCRRLKANLATRPIPILLVSARHGSEAVLQAFAAGADDYVTKPFSPPELLARIQAQIRIRLLATTLLRLEKQNSLGLLSAGIAHELLNPVNAVINAVLPLRRTYARLALESREAHQSAALLDAVEASGHRMHSVVKGLLAYTRQERVPRPHAARLSEEIEGVLTILQYRTTDVTIHRDYAWDEPVVHYPEWVDQVVMNLVVNALDAMNGRGELWIHISRVGGSVCIRVRDTGPGIEPELRERIFSPFFTTKPPGKGTGLGLAVAREIVAMHGGKLELDASVRSGAEFVVSLPLELPEGAG